VISTAALTGLLGAVVGTSFISGVLSLAGGTILMGIFNWVMPVSVAMVLHGVTQMSSNGSRCIIYRKHIHWPILRGYLFGAAMCIAIFSWILFVPSKTVVFLLLGAMPFVNYLIPKRFALDITKPGMPTLCGFTVTACTFLAGVSGTILDVFYFKSPLTRYQIHATKGFTQTLGHIAKIVYYLLVLDLVQDTAIPFPLWVFAAVIPLAFVGNWFAKHVVQVLQDHHFRSLTQYATMAIGVVFLIRGLTLIGQ